MIWSLRTIAFVLLSALSATRGLQARGKIRGAQLSTNNSILLENIEQSRRLQAKDCTQTLSSDRGGAGGLTNTSQTQFGPLIASQCEEMTIRHRLEGNGLAREANNFGGNILDPPCDRNFFGRATWWNFIGMGERVLVSTCHAATNISTALFLYQSPNYLCDAIECVARSNLNQCGAGGVDTFFADQNVLYYLSILGDNGNNRNEVGPEGEMAVSFTRQSNGCTTSIPLLNSRGIVAEAVLDESTSLVGPQCDSNLNGHGVWYQLLGTGETILLSTCHNATTIPTAISVYESPVNMTGNTCNGLKCQDFASSSPSCLDANNQSKGSLIKIKTTVDLTHYVAIVGDNGNNDVYPPGPEGTVGVNMVREFNGCDRDLAPLLLDDGSVVVTSTSADEGAPMVGPQCNQNFNGYGRWYHFVGQGEPVLVSTCHQGTTIPTVVSVYEAGDDIGSCQTSTCKAFNDSNLCENGNGSIVFLPEAEEGKMHYLSVLGHNGNALYPPAPEGTISVNVVTRSNGCDEARSLSDDGSKTMVDTASAPLLGPQCGMQYNGKGYWFEIVGKGRQVEASTCHVETTIPTIISVYQSSHGGCGSELTCYAMETTSPNDCSPLSFFAEEGIVYKISVMGDNGNSLLPAPEGQIGLSITRQVTCPCWSMAELEESTPDIITYLAESCNTIITGDLRTLSFPTNSASISILDNDGQGVMIASLGFVDPRIECYIEGPTISRLIEYVNLDDEVEACLAILYERCGTLSRAGGVWSMFEEACSPENFSDTIFSSQIGAGYHGCLKVATEAPSSPPSNSTSDAPVSQPSSTPSASPSIFCPCWTANELATATPLSLNYTEESCNTEIVGDLDAVSNPPSRAGIRVVDEAGLGARIVRLGPNDNRVACTMAGGLTRSILSLQPDEVEACLVLLYDRCSELSEAGGINSTFSSQCSFLDFSNTLLVSQDNADYDNCLQLAASG